MRTTALAFCVLCVLVLNAPMGSCEELELEGIREVPPKKDLANLPRPWRKANELYREIGELVGNGSIDEALARLGDAEKELPAAYAKFASGKAKRLRILRDHKRALGYMCGNLGVPNNGIRFVEEYKQSLKVPDRGIDMAIAGLLLEAGETAAARTAYEKLLATTGEFGWAQMFENRLNLIEAMEREPESFDVLLWSAQDRFKGCDEADTWESFLGPVLQLDDALEHAENGYEQAAVIQRLLDVLRNLSYGGDSATVSAWEEVMADFPTGSNVTCAGFYIERVKARYAKDWFKQSFLGRERKERARIDLKGYRLGEFEITQEEREQGELITRLITELGSKDRDTVSTAQRRLAKLGGHGLDGVIGALASENPAVREQAAVALALARHEYTASDKRRARRAVSALTEAILKEEDHVLKFRILRLLSNYEDMVPRESWESLLPVILEGLASPNKETRNLVLWVCRCLPQEERYGRLLVPHVLEGLSSPDGNTRLVSLGVCERFPRGEFLGKVLALAAWETDPALLGRILRTLSKFPDSRAAHAIIKYLDHNEVGYQAREAIKENHTGLHPAFLAQRHAYEAMAKLAVEDRTHWHDIRYRLLKACTDSALSGADRSRARNAFIALLWNEAGGRTRLPEEERLERGVWPKHERGYRMLYVLSLFGRHADLFPQIFFRVQRGNNPTGTSCWEANKYFLMNPSVLAATYVSFHDKQGVEPCLVDWIEGMSVGELDETIERIKTLSVFKDEVAEKREGPASQLVSRLEEACEQPMLSELELRISPALGPYEYLGVEPIPIRLELTNRSDKVLVLPGIGNQRIESGPQNVLRWLVVSEDGKWLSPRPLIACPLFPAGPVQLEPGQSTVGEWDIGYAFPWDRPGQFKVRAKYGYREKPSASWHGYLTSNDLTVEIKPLDFRNDAVLDGIRKLLHGHPINLPDGGGIEGIREHVLLNLFQSASDTGRVKLCMYMVEVLGVSGLPRWTKKFFFRALENLEDREQAIAMITGLLQTIPDAHFHLAGVYYGRKDYHKASEHFLRYIELGRDKKLRPRALDLLARCYDGSGSRKGAIQEALKRVKAYREDAEGFRADQLLWIISGWYEGMGDSKRALVALQAIDEENLASPDSRYDQIRARLRDLRDKLSRLRN